MVQGINNKLIWLDTKCERIPVLSTLTNLVNLIGKAIIECFVDNYTVDGSRYLSYLKGKTFKQCLLLLIPIAGNIIAAVNQNAFHLARFQNYTPRHKLFCYQVDEAFTQALLEKESFDANPRGLYVYKHVPDSMWDEDEFLKGFLARAPSSLTRYCGLEFNDDFKKRILKIDPKYLELVINDCSDYRLMSFDVEKVQNLILEVPEAFPHIPQKWIPSVCTEAFFHQILDSETCLAYFLDKHELLAPFWDKVKRDQLVLFNCLVHISCINQRHEKI